MIIICFQGGLGNQMFQYAYYLQIKHLYPNAKVFADISDYKCENSIRRFELEEIFGIKLEKASLLNIFRLSNKVPGSSKYSFIRRRLDKKMANLLNTTVDRLRPHYFFLNNRIKTDFDEQKNYFLEGFWQNEEAFSGVKEDVVSTFRNVIDNPLIAKIKPDEYINNWNSYNTVSVHIRRTDYLTESNFVNLTENYYKRAIRYINDKVEKPLFVFFSDDTNYVMEKYSWLKNKKIITENTGENSYKDMLLMAECKHNIIANSTFSYWGAYLNINPDKIIIAPNRFLKDNLTPLAANGWLLMDVE